MSSYKRIENNCNISKITAWRYFEEISDLILSVAHAYIKFPEQNEFEELSNAFYRKGRYRGTILAIDGTEIGFTKPSNDPFNFYTRKMTFALKLICVVDYKKRIRGVSFGFGSSHDAYIYRVSNLKNKIDNLPEAYHVVGDPAFSGFNNIISTYESSNNFNSPEILDSLKKQRIIVENAFGLFKINSKDFGIGH